MNQPRSYPNILQSIGLAFILMCMLLLTSQLSRLLPQALGQEAIMFIAYTTAMSLSIWMITAISKAFKTQQSFHFNIKGIATPCLILMATLALLIGIIYPISLLIPISEASRAVFETVFHQPNIFTFLAVVIAAPFLEEYIFRGVLLDGLLKNYSSTLSILLSSLLFGLFHGNPLQIISAFIGGIYIGWIYYKTKNLLYCILIHFIINLVGFLLLRIIGIKALLDIQFEDLYGNSAIATLLPIMALIIFGYSVYILNKKLT